MATHRHDFTLQTENAPDTLQQLTASSAILCSALKPVQQSFIADMHGERLHSVSAGEGVARVAEDVPRLFGDPGKFDYCSQACQVSACASTQACAASSTLFPSASMPSISIWSSVV